MQFPVNNPAKLKKLWRMTLIKIETTHLRERDEYSLDFAAEFSGISHVVQQWS